MKKSFLALATAVVLCLSATSRADEDAPPPAPVAPLQEGVRVPILEPLAMRPAEIAPPFALPDIAGNLISSRAWLSQRSLLVLSLGDPAPANPDAPTPPVAANAPLSPDQVLAARRVAEAVQGAAPKLRQRGVVIVIIASGPYFTAMKDALGADFKAASVPEVLEPTSPNLFLLRDDAPANATAGKDDRRVRWSDLAGRTETGVALTGIDRAGFVRSNEAVADLLNLEPLLVLTGDVTPRVDIGQPAPDFSIRDANGRVRRLSDLRGQRNLLLTFFPKCFTGG